MTPEIVILAMIAAFLGLRLYSVLGRRAEHEEEPIQGRFEGRQGRPGAPRVPAQQKPDAKSEDRGQADQVQRPREMPLVPAPAERGLAEIASADRRFDAFAFLEGARGAYRMILEAFWKGDKEELRHLCDDEVYASFAGAIDARVEAGETLENRLVRIEECAVIAAGVENGFARITLRFRADIAAVTRNAEGDVIAGSLDDAVEAVDVWTFTRALNSPDPDWLLDETDQG
ncbi:Tim44/TimA family putative adaptor protein [Novosphingobium mangrovi (ex Huang et al. 2023)]|uniref:Tim44/TimA family putative adaptor protein n=1 Tax=Novosphingobium mangrovi (ex Huang et al. 2023) TaxID=2976432 RepID=A0ABT2I2N6_9SPHN|nr:Tim44/TimA family putative adaptor protein [Novosphingobium mangrovi (ex Huang et al. 2023)]MCT2399069.1 Tim44/TimA family putative adaptor protein [Novosphingobium mangrovi (ex Huang et al. 2023)]